ncbi:DUF551 domain-containing protein, partial [Phytobacter ursingii]
GKNSLNRLIRCVCGKKIGPDPRNFNQRVSLGRNDLLIRTFPSFHCFRTKTVVVSDGFDVGICDCQAGNMPNAWVDWSIHGDIDADKITHWMPLPEPPTE